MTARQIIERIEQARAEGLEVAINWARGGYWTRPSETFEVREGCLYWERSSGRTFLIPPGQIYLEFAPGGSLSV